MAWLKVTGGENHLCVINLNTVKRIRPSGPNDIAIQYNDGTDEIWLYGVRYQDVLSAIQGRAWLSCKHGNVSVLSTWDEHYREVREL
jgi:hypothetical protein